MGQLNVRNLPEVHFQQMAADGVHSDHVFAGVCRVRMPLAYVRDTDLILIDCPAGKLELLIPSGAGEAPIKALSDCTESFHHSFTFGNTDP